jgi:hypothetical protein
MSFIPFQKEPWNTSQLLAPSALAAAIKGESSDTPLIISVGPGGLIKGSVDIGPANEKNNLEKLKTFLSEKPKDERIVIYCGCCPFEHCPNVRPAFTLLNRMGFTHHQLLDLSHNLKTDWIDHGYPVQDLRQ